MKHMRPMERFMLSMHSMVALIDYLTWYLVRRAVSSRACDPPEKKTPWEDSTWAASSASCTAWR